LRFLLGSKPGSDDFTADVFVDVIYRTIKFEFREDTELKGISVKRFQLPTDLLGVNPDFDQFSEGVGNFECISWIGASLAEFGPPVRLTKPLFRDAKLPRSVQNEWYSDGLIAKAPSTGQSEPLITEGEHTSFENHETWIVRLFFWFSVFLLVFCFAFSFLLVFCRLSVFLLVFCLLSVFLLVFCWLSVLCWYFVGFQFSVFCWYFVGSVGILLAFSFSIGILLRFITVGILSACSFSVGILSLSAFLLVFCWLSVFLLLFTFLLVFCLSLCFVMFVICIGCRTLSQLRVQCWLPTNVYKPII